MGVWKIILQLFHPHYQSVIEGSLNIHPRGFSSGQNAATESVLDVTIKGN